MSDAVIVNLVELLLCIVILRLAWPLISIAVVVLSAFLVLAIGAGIAGTALVVWIVTFVVSFVITWFAKSAYALGRRSMPGRGAEFR